MEPISAVMHLGCQSGSMHHPHDQERWTKALQQHAARISFPDWRPSDDDWTDRAGGTARD